MTIENLNDGPVEEKNSKKHVVVCDDGFGLITTRTVSSDEPLRPGEHPAELLVGLDIPDGRRR